MNNCSRRCRYFDYHGHGTKGDCRALGGSHHKSVNLFRKAILSVTSGHETWSGRKCPHEGPYMGKQAYQGKEQGV